MIVSSRRNQTRTERAYYLGCRYNREKGPAHRPAGKLEQNVPVNGVAELIAKEEKVSHMTVQRAAKFAQHIDRNARARRNQTRTEKAYYIGCEYNRRKGERGTNQHTKARKGQSDLSSSTYDLIAREEKTSPKTVQRAAKFAAHIDSMGKSFAWLKWLIPVKYRTVRYLG